MGRRIRHSPRVVNLTLHNGDTSFPYSTAANCVNYILQLSKVYYFIKVKVRRLGRRKRGRGGRRCGGGGERGRGEYESIENGKIFN